MENNSKEKLKIAILTENFYPGTGGAEKAIECLANSFCKDGHEVMVCVPKYWDCEERGLYICNRTKSIKVANNAYLPLPNKSKDFKKRLDDFNPDILHCNGNNAMLSFAVKYGKKHKIPVVYTAHTKLYMYLYSKTHSKFISSVYAKWVGKRLKKCDRVTAVSHSMRKEFNFYGYKGDFVVIKNGCTYNRHELDKDAKLLAQQKYGITEKDNILLFVGHIESCKNVYFIFEALKKLFEKTKNFKMFFVGSVDEKKFYKKVKKSCIKDNVIFTEQITDRNLLSSIYANTKLFLFPSVFDNDSLAIIESAIHNVPSMVLKDTGSSERITNNVNGFIIDSESDMANRIFELLENQKLIESVGKQASIDLPQDWSLSANKYEELFYDVIKEFNSSKK